MAKSNAKRRLQLRKVLSVTDGHTALGIIEEGANCVCRDVAGNKIAVVQDRKAAMQVFFDRKQPGTILVEG